MSVSALASLVVAAVGTGVLGGAEAVASEPRVDVEVCEHEDPDFGIHTHPLDIDGVTVTRSPEGEISFGVTFTDAFDLEPDVGFAVAIDADADVATGDPTGDEFLFEYVERGAGSQPALFTWQRAEWREVSSRSLTFSHKANEVVFAIESRELGAPSLFAYWLFAGTAWTTDEADIDVALQREHVIVSTDRPEKWTFPSCGTIAVPEDTAGEDDDADLAIGFVILGLFVLGGLAGIGGWLYERHHRRRKQKGQDPSLPVSESGS